MENKPVSRSEFDKRISQIPGVKDDGQGNWLGIRVLTPLERKEREDNAKENEKPTRSERAIKSEKPRNEERAKNYE